GLPPGTRGGGPPAAAWQDRLFDGRGNDERKDRGSAGARDGVAVIDRLDAVIPGVQLVGGEGGRGDAADVAQRAAAELRRAVHEVDRPRRLGAAGRGRDRGRERNVLGNLRGGWRDGQGR